MEQPDKATQAETHMHRLRLMKLMVAVAAEPGRQGQMQQQVAQEMAVLVFSHQLPAPQLTTQAAAEARHILILL